MATFYRASLRAVDRGAGWYPWHSPFWGHMAVEGHEEAYSCAVHFEEGRVWVPGERREVAMSFFWTRLPFAFEVVGVRVYRHALMFTGELSNGMTGAIPQGKKSGGGNDASADTHLVPITFEELGRAGVRLQHRLSVSRSFEDFARSSGSNPEIIYRDGLGDWSVVCFVLEQGMVVMLGVPIDRWSEGMSIFVGDDADLHAARQALSTTIGEGVLWARADTGEPI